MPDGKSDSPCDDAKIAAAAKEAHAMLMWLSGWLAVNGAVRRADKFNYDLTWHEAVKEYLDKTRRTP